MRALGIFVWLGLAASLAGQTGGPEPEALLARIKAHVGESLKRLPNYTCLETVERFERRGGSSPLVLVDRLRLEVAMVGRKEFYAWPGESKFEEKTIGQLIPHGTIGNGDFALHAYAVFVARGPEFTYAGETDRNGRRLIAVILGSYSGAVRAQKAAALLERGFNSGSLNWLTPSLGTVDALAPIDAQPPNLRE